MQKQYEKKNVWEKSNDAHSLSIRVQTTGNHMSIFTFLFFFYHNINVKENAFLEREVKKALRDTLARVAWLGPTNLLLFFSEQAHAAYPGIFPEDSISALPGSAPIGGRKKGASFFS